MPGISRSGSTVVTALLLGVEPLAAAEFSFLMSIIAITGAAARVAPELVAVSTQGAAPFIYGGLAALVSGLAALWLFARMMRRRRLFRYAYYTWGAGTVFLIYLQFAK
jgi:undecaprenyl-diphosphatase